jgi:hypothetical protein
MRQRLPISLPQYVGASATVRDRATNAIVSVFSTETGSTTLTNPGQISVASDGSLPGWVYRGSLRVTLTGGGIVGSLVLDVESNPGNIAYVTSLPASPYNGQEAYLQVDAAGTYGGPFIWHIRYNSGLAGSHKWEVISAAPLTHVVATEESAAFNATFADLTTPGPSITPPFAGVYQTSWSVESKNSASGNLTRVSYAHDIAAADSTNSYTDGATWAEQHRAFDKTMTAGLAFALKYRASAGTGTWAHRVLRIAPIRIG